ncbi:MAG: hemolysin family protein [Treponema sp.]|nr:hemolysin family protein [Treponema sp.]
MNKEDPHLWRLLLQFVLIMINAVFACAEIALISVNDNKLEKLAAQGDKRASRLLALTKQPAKFLATIQVGITLAGFLGSAFAADSFSGVLTEQFVSWGVKIRREYLETVSLVCITIILSFFTLVLGELVPKRIAMKKAEKLAFAMSAFIWLISKLFAPVVWFLTKSTNALLRLLRIDPEAEEKAITEEEIRMLLDMGSAKGTIDEGEKDIIHNVFEFGDKTVAEVMTHRLDTILLWQDESDSEWEKTVIENRHSYYPVCGKDQDDIIGVLRARIFLALRDRSRNAVMAEAVQPAQFVPKTIKTDILFKKMKKSRNHFAVVLDEYGGLNGVVAMNDLLEELVGDLEDDNMAPPEEPEIKKTGPLEWCVNGAVSLDKLNRETGLNLPSDKYNTFAGFVFSLLGQIPDNGETPVISTLAGIEIQILEIHGHRLEKAQVRILDKEGGKGGE